MGRKARRWTRRDGDHHSARLQEVRCCALLDVRGRFQVRGVVRRGKSCDDARQLSLQKSQLRGLDDCSLRVGDLSLAIPVPLTSLWL